MAVKFIDYWMFASCLWEDADMTPITINMREIVTITEQKCDKFGNYIEITLKNGLQIPIDGNIIEVLAEFQKHLSNMY